MASFVTRIAAILLTVCLAACANAPVGSNSDERFASVARGTDFLPGNAKFYSYGVSQSKENFANIERAQSDYSLYKGRRYWTDDKPGRSSGTLNLLQQYYLLHVRWQLKDGHQFIAENIDVRAVMQEYFKTHRIVLPYQKEGRTYSANGDFDPTLVHELKDDTVILKWLITTLKTSPNERFTKDMVANPWKFEYEEHIVTTIKGTPTVGIDFEKHWEFSNGHKQ
ncbi:hypothetical protein KIK84_01990 [Curvibacter sp. CHRR-16]|uniref:hypothetical protein n=1 Tax=Curvibacter sp. CHRR-16 TaxID=2835872 RepID=UPI001BDB1251|nr:hypothetical protein [Curvibacter sp. CHRR-16]MBT0569086.1 hypothetical protein [Curvibacter sp. CHRR-16]